MPTPLPSIDPMPPRAGRALPWLGAGLALLRDPTAFFARARRAHGDTFVADAFGHRLFCLFSPAGVRALYALAERDASKGLADFALLRHKLPDEMWAGRRNRPHDLFGGEQTETWIGHVAAAVDQALDALGAAGTVELFTWTRQLGHRVGLAAWAGAEAASPARLPTLARALDRLDASESFVHPARALRTWVTRKRRERRALRELETVMAGIVRARAAQATPPDDLLARIIASWHDVEPRTRETGVARDVVLIHLGSQSNLYAAMAWTLMALLARPALLARVRAGDDALLEACASEAIRVAQRSITLRQVCREIEVDDGRRAYRLAPGTFVTTMLSVTNTTAAPGLEVFDPARWAGRRLAAADDLPARELVSTFGHGRHACPAQRFSIAAIRLAVGSLCRRFHLSPRWRDVGPLRQQIGGVARADRPCRLTYHAR